jgi:hypothetical protein
MKGNATSSQAKPCAVLHKHVPICNFTIRWGIVIIITSILEVRLFQCMSLRLQKSAKLTPPITSLATTCEALAERNCALVEQRLHILRLVTIVLVRTSVSALRVATTFQGLRAVDEADIQDTGERLHV